MRKELVDFIASILDVDVIFPPEKDECIEPNIRECRLAKETMYDGEVFWYVEEYFRSRKDCEMFAPFSIGELYDKFHSRTNGKLDDRVYFWARHPKRCNSMEEAIEYLNTKVKKKLPLEVSYVKVE